jgi:CoA:oxalate CoA-transferase
VVQGTSGLMTITGAKGGEPTKPGLPIADLSAGMYAFGAILAALRGRDASSPPKGTQLDIAMHDSTVSLLEGAALSFLATGNPPPRMGNAHYSIAPFDTFAASDRLFVICAANDQLFANLALAIGRPELPGDARFISNRLRHDNRDELKEELELSLAAHPAEEWLSILGQAGVPCGPVSDVAEALSSEQAKARGLVMEVGGMPMPSNPIHLSAYPQVLPDPAPALDQHGEALRREFDC